MSKKNQSKSLLEPKNSIQEINYHLSWWVKLLLFFTFPFWVVPFIFTSLFLGQKIRKSLQKLPSSGVSSKSDFVGIQVNSLQYYNRSMELKKGSNKLLISGAQWEEMSPQDITIESFDGVQLATFLIKAKRPTNKWVVVCHGWLQNRFSVLYLVVPFYQAGYNILVYDARNHGSSTKTSCTFGFKEAQDLFFVVKYLSHNITPEEAKKISLIGNSMGATTILQALQTFDLTALGVVCAISDCGYDDFSGMVKILGQQEFKIHWFWTYFGVMFLLKWKDKFDINEIKPVNKMKYCAKTPILFIHGSLDQTVPLSMSQKMYKEKIKYEGKQLSELLIIPNAGHVQSIIVDYQSYSKTSLQFVKHWTDTSKK